MKKAVFILAALSAALAVGAQTRTNESMITYHKIQVEDCNVFYREAGAPEKPAILLLHGFPSSSQRDNQPPLLAVWGENDPSFIPAGAHAFKRDLPGAEIHFVPSGHFALESHHAEIAGLMREFLRKVIRK